MEDAIIVSGKENLTLLGGDAVIVEDTNAKVSITASKGKDTIYTSGSNVDIDLKAGGATEIFAAQGRATVENYKATSGAAFLTENENIADAIADNSIAYDDGKLTVNSARATLQSVSSGDDAARILTLIDGKETKTAIAQEGGIIATGDELADVYYGKKSGVDFTGFENSLTIDLSKNFYGINQITVGGGQNTFYYLQGNGSDTIAGAHDGDEVILSTVTLDQISGTFITADAVSINFTDGGSLQINSNANVTYQLADGSKYAANHAQAAWIAK